MQENLTDLRYCLRMQQEYEAKARAATTATLRAAYEAAARRFAKRIRQLVSDGLNDRITD